MFSRSRARPAAGATPVLPAQAERVERWMRRRLLSFARKTFAPHALSALLVGGVYWSLTHRRAVFLWLGLAAVALVARLAVALANERRYPATEHPDGPPGGEAPYLGPLLALSIVWGLSPFLLLPPGPLNVELAALLGVALCAMLMGSVPAVALWRPAIAAWLIPLTAGMAVYGAMHGGPAGWFLCLGILLFSAWIARLALAQRQMIANSVAMQFEMEALSEQLAAQKGDLERLNEERTRFFASASHDLRQPVHALALLSDAMRRELADHPARPMAEQVGVATASVGHLLDAMLDISRIDAGAVQAVAKPVALVDVFAQLSQVQGPRVQAAGLSLRVQASGHTLDTDAVLLLRILSNLVDNAIKHAPRALGGRRILVTARRRGAGLRIAVRDEGPGVAAEHLPRLYEEFYQVGNPERDAARGLGIGLAVVRRLAALLGGRTGVHSVPGRGSAFWVDLPLSAGQGPVSGFGESTLAPMAAEASTPMHLEPVHSHTHTHTLHSRQPNVLLLDDERAVGDAMRLWLQPYCSAVHATRTLAEAQAVVAREGAALDVMLVDFRLAGAVNGIEAVHRLRRAAGRELPAILITGDTEPARVRAAYDSGLAVVFKPVQPQLLAQMLQAAAATPG
ncbi:MAG: hybrid sensor histidine kinase/response regulator [Bordetella sp.]|nr:hybrid sensor histidine kinase/response regulator [Pseudomonadota bacterium]